MGKNPGFSPWGPIRPGPRAQQKCGCGPKETFPEISKKIQDFPMSQDQIGKSRKISENSGKSREVPDNLGKSRKIPENPATSRKTSENPGKSWKQPWNISDKPGTSDKISECIRTYRKMPGHIFLNISEIIGRIPVICRGKGGGSPFVGCLSRDLSGVPFVGCRPCFPWWDAL